MRLLAKGKSLIGACIKMLFQLFKLTAKSLKLAALKYSLIIFGSYRSAPANG